MQINLIFKNIIFYFNDRDFSGKFKANTNELNLRPVVHDDFLSK